MPPCWSQLQWIFHIMIISWRPFEKTLWVFVSAAAAIVSFGMDHGQTRISSLKAIRGAVTAHRLNYRLSGVYTCGVS
jgi:hypothetical protein